MRTVGPRSNLKKTYPRCHYNSKGKTKKQFQTVKEAEEYIASHKLEGYTIYKCLVCNMYHISHKNKEKENGQIEKTHNGECPGSIEPGIQNEKEAGPAKRRA